MSPARKKQVLAALTLLIAGSALGFVAMSDIEENLVYYLDVAQLIEKGSSAHNTTVRLGGVVQEKSLDWNPQTLDLAFRVGMTGAPDEVGVKVSSKGAPPQMFRERIGVVLEGEYDGATFHADRVMVKHSNEYRPPAAGERPQEVYKTLVSD